jgi:Fe-S cluster assembly ATP-binding protein
LNDGFSGGEKKRFEMLQLLLLKPKLIILDEIDSGLDVDALAIVTHALNVVRKENPAVTILVITHYQRILHHLVPDVVHIMHNGTIVHSGPCQLAQEIEDKGYDVYCQIQS